jgi:tRNA threonylcarbamoyladenosine biosynthesis protein TsaE
MKFTYSLSEITQIAQKTIAAAETKVLLFDGEMGAGKTTLIKEIVKILGSIDNVSSPTFSLVNEYETQTGPIFHFDFYRIDDEEEAMDIGFEEYLDSNNWKLIEWPEKVENLLPREFTKIQIKVLENGLREINLENKIN